MEFQPVVEVVQVDRITRSFWSITQTVGLQNRLTRLVSVNVASNGRIATPELMVGTILLMGIRISLGDNSLFEA
jgi:hypothetical protein